MTGTARRLDLVLPGFVPDSRLSLNGRHRTHWAVLRGCREAAWIATRVAIHQYCNTYVRPTLPRDTDGKLTIGYIMQPPAFARVGIEFVYPIRRRRDPDGLAGLAKPILDELQTWGLIKDDDSEHIELSVRAVVEPKTTETRISITEELP